MSRAESRPVAAADHPYDRVPAWEVAWDIRRVAGEIGHTPVKHEYRARGEFSPSTGRARFGTWLKALREGAGLAPRLCQRHPEGGTRDVIGRAARAAFDEHGRPPTCREVVAERERDSELKYAGRWDDQLRSWGIPGQGEWVADAIADLLADRHPWQSFLDVPTRVVAEASRMDTSRVGTILAEFVDGRRDADIDGRFDIERQAASAGTRWRIWPAEEGQR